MTPKQRLSAIQRSNCCVNCLRADHKAKDCQAGSCQTCNQKHNTLLHLETASVTSASSLNTSTKRVSEATTVLSTVQILVQDKNGKNISCRALLDSGSQINFVTNRLIQRLGFKGEPHSIKIEGIGQSSGTSTARINLLISSSVINYNTRLEAHILKTIVSNQPVRDLDISTWNIPQNIKLADPQFNHSGSIDLLIGAGIFYSLLSVGQISLGSGLPSLQNSVFGWIIGGGYEGEVSAYKVTCGVNVEDTTLNQSLERFWNVEEANQSNSNFTSAETRVEEHFTNTTQRSADGRFIVKLPFQQDSSLLGESKSIALQRFYAVERKLGKNTELRNQYAAFMREYEQLGHMKLVLPSDIPTPHYFLPHHAVLKPDSSTTKCRVVFDASAKTSTNVSLNNILSAGPSIQDDVFTVLMRFRRYRFVFTADIEKMYRQILINDEDKRYQLIWWRENPEEPLKCYQLNTVTYGTTCAPYLAIRTLRALADHGNVQFPLAAEAIRSNFYVDDVLAGADHLPTAKATQAQVRQLLESAGLKLRKWCTNHPQLLQPIPKEDRETLVTFYDQGNEAIKTMGLIWNPTTDQFGVKVGECEKQRVTKRSALSDISQLFDPLGFLAPFTVTAKMFLQQLWKLEIDWDAALPQDLHTKWQSFKEELNQLRDIKIQRHLFADGSPQQAEIHIFSDASERAFGAVAYMRTK